MEDIFIDYLLEQEFDLDIPEYRKLQQELKNLCGEDKVDKSFGS